MSIQGMLSQAGVSIDPNTLQAIAETLTSGQGGFMGGVASNILNQLMSIKTTYTITGLPVTFARISNPVLAS